MMIKFYQTNPIITPQETAWTYNNRGFMTAKTYADGSSVNYTYNAEGQLLTRTWARGIVTTYTYDNAGRQTGYNYSDGTTPSVTIALNFLDQQTAITDAAGTRIFSYNANHMLASETDPLVDNSVMTYTYDAYGRRTAMHFENENTTFANANYTYDTRGRIATVGNNTDTLTYTYVPGTNMVQSQEWQSANINTAFTYDQYKRLTNIAVNNTPVYGYTLNDKNQRIEATLPDGNTWNYTYDGIGQLTLAQNFTSASTLLGTHAFSYDQIGNRTNAIENNTTTNYASNLVNQYTQIASQIPVYDADGNMTSYNGWTYTYNGENRLIAAENVATGVRVEADYDYMGRRAYKKVYTNNSLTLHRKFVYDGYKLISEFDALNNDAQIASYLWQPVGMDVPLMRNNEYCITDGNKNIIELRSATGAVMTSYTYNPFGEIESPTVGDDNPFRFSSEYHDDKIGLVYYNYRYYSPSHGRWINRDPIEEQGRVNLYIIVNNNIANSWDILGLQYLLLLYDSADSMFSTLAEVNFTDNAVIKFYHCHIARLFNIDRNGLLTFFDTTSLMPESPNNARESILTYYKKLLYDQGYGDVKIYGSPKGISNGYPFFRGYPRISGAEKKITENHHHINCPYCGGN